MGFAVVNVAVYLAGCVLLYVNADDVTEQVWSHWIKLFEALGPLVGLAAGWVFGKEVHRKAAEDARRVADKGLRLAGAITQAQRSYRNSNASAAVEDSDNTGADATKTAAAHLDSLAEEVHMLFST